MTSIIDKISKGWAEFLLLLAGTSCFLIIQKGTSFLKGIPQIYPSLISRLSDLYWCTEIREEAIWNIDNRSVRSTIWNISTSTVITETSLVNATSLFSLGQTWCAISRVRHECTLSQSPMLRDECEPCLSSGAWCLPCGSPNGNCRGLQWWQRVGIKHLLDVLLAPL